MVRMAWMRSGVIMAAGSGVPTHHAGGSLAGVHGGDAGGRSASRVILLHSQRTEPHLGAHGRMLTPEQRAIYAEANRLLVEEIREHGHAVTGRWVGRLALLLTTTGARSGAPRMSPLAYSLDDGRYIVTASKGGSPTHPGWYHNLLADPIATIEVDQRTFQARASTAEGTERERLWLHHIALHPGIGEYPALTSRIIPVVILDPLP